MEDTKDLCNQILELIDKLNSPELLRFDDISIVIQYCLLDEYGDVCSFIYITVYQEETDILCIDSNSNYGVQCEVLERGVNTQWFLQHVIKLLKLRLERDKHE